MIKVTCAIIRNEENEVLVVQRGEKKDHPFKWEFPGGKLKEGETDEECIMRGIREELSMEILYRLSVIYPELANELSASINMLRGEDSAGVVARGRIILKKLAEITEDPGSGQS